MSDVRSLFLLLSSGILLNIKPVSMHFHPTSPPFLEFSISQKNLQFSFLQAKNYISLFFQLTRMGDDYHAPDLWALFFKITEIPVAVSTSRLPVGSSTRILCITGKGVGYGNTLLLAAGQFGGQRDILHRCKVVDQVVALKNKRHMIMPVFGKANLFNIFSMI